MKTTDIGFERFSEDFYADPSTAFVKTEFILEALRFIEAQLDDGYIDLGLHDDIELNIVKKAIKEYKVNHGCTKE